MKARLRGYQVFMLNNRILLQQYPVKNLNQRYLLSRHKNLSNNTFKKCLPNLQTSGAFFPKAGITVEASLILPLMLLIFAVFFSFFSAQLWQLRFQKALDEIGEDIAVWSHVLDFADDYTGSSLLTLAEGGKLSSALGESPGEMISLLQEENRMEEVKLFLLEKGSALLWQAGIKAWLVRKLGQNKLDGSLVQKGSQGLSLSGSTLHDRELDLVLTYRFRPLFGELFGISVPVVQRSCRRLWIGTPVEKEAAGAEEQETEEKEEEPLVYVTENGRAYHGSQDCRVFKIHPLFVSLVSVGGLRNEEGAKYYACERCALGREPLPMVWLTDFGNRYHHEEDCPSLKRMIISLSLSEAQEKYKPCGFCGGRHE